MKTHTTDLVSMFAGLFFLLVAAVGFSDRLGIEFNDTRWIWPVGLMVLGVIVLVSTGMRRDERDVLTSGQDAGVSSEETSDW